MARYDPTPVRLFVTVSPNYRQGGTHPLAVHVETASHTADGLDGARSHPIDVRDMRHAYSYANGFNDALLRLTNKTVPIVVDPRFTLEGN